MVFFLAAAPMTDDSASDAVTTVIPTPDPSTTEAPVVPTSSAPSAPSIIGPWEMNLVQGNSARTTPFAIHGNPKPAVTVSGDVKITWNDETKRIEIADGLAPGTYTAILRAANGVSPDAEFTFTLNVISEDDAMRQEPERGPGGNIVLWIVIIVLAGFAAVTAVLIVKVRKNNEKKN